MSTTGEVNNILTIQSIKDMNDEQRSLLMAEDLIKLILSLDVSPKIETDISDKVNRLATIIELTQQEARYNTAAILNLTSCNEKLETENIKLGTAVTELRREIDAIQQYMRVDNVEVVGLPVDKINNDDEGMLLDLFDNMNLEIRSCDIDICHEVNTRRKDGKRVVICKFISRKSKIAVLEAKREHRDLRYKGNNIFINEHLSPPNRRLFALAYQVKKDNDYKYLWTRNGTVLMRKSDISPILEIYNEEFLNTLS